MAMDTPATVPSRSGVDSENATARRFVFSPRAREFRPGSAHIRGAENRGPVRGEGTLRDVDFGHHADREYRTPAARRTYAPMPRAYATPATRDTDSALDDAPTEVRRPNRTVEYPLPARDQPGHPSLTSTPAEEASVRSLSRSEEGSEAYTWTGAYVQTRHGALPSPYQQEAEEFVGAPASAATGPAAPRSRPAASIRSLREGREPTPSSATAPKARSAGQNADDSSWWRQPPPEGEAPAQRHTRIPNASGGTEGLPAALTMHESESHNASTPLTTATTESPIPMIGRMSPSAQTSPATRSSPVVTLLSSVRMSEAGYADQTVTPDAGRPAPSTLTVTDTELCPSVRRKVENIAGSPLPPTITVTDTESSAANLTTAEGGHIAPDSVSRPQPQTAGPANTTPSVRPANSRIPVQFVRSSPSSGVMAMTPRVEGSRRDRRRQRMDQYWGAVQQYPRSRVGRHHRLEQYYPADSRFISGPPLHVPHAGHPGGVGTMAGVVPTATFAPEPSAMTQLMANPVPAEASVTAMQQQIAAYFQAYHQQLALQYPAAFGAGNSATQTAVEPAKGTLPLPPSSPSAEPVTEDEEPPSSPKPSPPSSEHGDPSPSLMVLIWTLAGESLWLTSRVSTGSVTVHVAGEKEKYRYRLPSSSARSEGAESDILWSTLHHIGLNIQDLSAHGSVPSPLLLEGVEGITAYAVQLSREQVSSARLRAEKRQLLRRLPVYAWVTIPDTARESELLDFDPLGLQAWAVLSSTEEFLLRKLPATGSSAPVPSGSPAANPLHIARRGVTPATVPSSPDRVAGMLPLDRGLAQRPGYHELMGEVSPDTVYRESKTHADILKLLADIPRYPLTEELVSTDADISALPPFTEALTNLVKRGVVAFALNRMSAYKLNQTVITMPELLRELAQRRLQPRSLAYLKQGGMMSTDAWDQRYTSLAPFLADVARSVLDDISLVGLAGMVMRMTQRREESARQYAARLAGWYEVTQLLADTLPDCPNIGKQLLYQFWSGLRMRSLVMDRLMTDQLQLQAPEEWERLHPGTTALQHVITVATKLENAERLSNPRPVPSASTPSPNRSSWKGNRAPARLNAVVETEEDAEEESSDHTASLNAQAGSSPTPSLTRAPRRCYVCGSTEHLWANCPDETKKAAWVADAPARLAKRRAANDAQVAALEADLEDMEDEADALDLFQSGELAAAVSSDLSAA